MKHLKVFESFTDKLYVEINSDIFFESIGDDSQDRLAFIEANFHKMQNQEIRRILNIVKKIELVRGLIDVEITNTEYKESCLRIFYKRDDKTSFYTTIMSVFKLNDEYFYVQSYDWAYLRDSHDLSDNGGYFKCDTIEGLLQLIKDNSDVISQYLEDC